MTETGWISRIFHRTVLGMVCSIGRFQFRDEPINQWRNWSKGSSLIQQSPGKQKQFEDILGEFYNSTIAIQWTN